MYIADPEIRSMLEMELNALNMYSVCANTRFERLICRDARISARYAFFYSSAREKDFERTKRAILNKAGHQDAFQAFLFIFAYPGERRGITDSILVLVGEGVIVIDATQIAMDQAVNEQYALNMAYASRYADNRDPAARAFTDRAYEALRPWTDRVVASPVQVYSRSNPKGSAYGSLQAFYDRIAADITRTYPYSPDTMDLDEFFYQTIGARYYVRPGYYAERVAIGGLKVGGADPSPEKTPEGLFDFVWGRDDGWDDPKYSGEKIVILKKAFDRTIKERFDEGASITFKEIFEAMRKPPYGLLPNVIGAILMGMFFRTWSHENLIWTNGFQQDVLDDSHLLSMVENGIHNQHTHYRNSLVDSIMPADGETSRLKEGISSIFGLDVSKSLFLSDLRFNLRIALEKLPYPILSVRYSNIGEADREFMGRLIEFAKHASDDDDRTAEDVLEACLSAAARTEDDLPRRIRAHLYGDKLREGFETMLRLHGIDPDEISADKLARMCNGHDEWKWIWQEESVIRGLCYDG